METTIKYATPDDLEAEKVRAMGVEKDHEARLTKLEAAVFPPPPTGPQYFLATNGDDRNPGTSELSPVKTWQKAREFCGPGVTINIRGGLYPEEMQDVKGGTEGALCTVRAYQGEPVTFKPNAGASRCITLANRVSVYLLFQKLKLDAGNCGYDVVKLTYGGTDKQNAAHHITLDECELFNCPKGQGILITNESHDNLMHKGSIHDIVLTKGIPDPSLAHGFYISGPRNWIKFVDIYRIAGSAGQFYSSDYNNIDDGGCEGGYYRETAMDGGPQNKRRPMISLNSGSRTKIIGVKMVGGLSTRGLDFMGGCRQHEARENEISGFSENGILVEGGAQGTILYKNKYSGNGRDYTDQGTGTVVTA